MKPISAIFLVIIFLFSTVFHANAQSADTIWIEATNQNHAIGEVVTVNLHAVTSTPIQGFAFQLSYDPSCVQPEQPSSSQTGMNSFPLPQETGLVDASFYSAAPQPISGPLTEIKFTLLAVCDATIKLENASLMILDETGIAHQLDGITLGTNMISLSTGNIPAADVSEEAQSDGDTSLVPLQPASTLVSVPVVTEPPLPGNYLPYWFGAMLSIALIVIIFLVGLFFFIKHRTRAIRLAYQPVTGIPVLYIEGGPRTGEFVEVTHSPFQIGRDTACELYLNDQRISRHHAQIITNRSGYCVVDLGSKNSTRVNGRSVSDRVVPLKPGDMVQLGKHISLIFAIKRRDRAEA